MIGNRFNGDNIAAEFQRILQKHNLEKKAQALFDSSAEDDPIENILNSGEDEEFDDSLSDPESFLMADELHADNISGALDGNIKALDGISESCPICGKRVCNCSDNKAVSANEYFDTTANHILTGLGKIAGSLKLKGHNFAADIVEATAMGIKDDFIKEASAKMAVAVELKKMAKDLSKSGNQMAADMVLATIDNIKKTS